MALERSKTLPKGFYWWDALSPEKAAAFTAWRSSHGAAVKVRSTVDHRDESPARTWFLFEVLEPSEWLDAAKFGFPTIATARTAEADTVQKPDPEKDPTDKLADAVDVNRLIEGAKTFSWVAALALGALTLFKLRRK